MPTLDINESTIFVSAVKPTHQLKYQATMFI